MIEPEWQRPHGRRAAFRTQPRWAPVLDPGLRQLIVEMPSANPVARPFTIRIPHNLLADGDIFEMFPENEKDCSHMQR